MSPILIQCYPQDHYLPAPSRSATLNSYPVVTSYMALATVSHMTMPKLAFWHRVWHRALRPMGTLWAPFDTNLSRIN